MTAEVVSLRPRTSPWNCTDAQALIDAGWAWCATNQEWYRTRGSKAFEGACATCKNHHDRSIP